MSAEEFQFNLFVASQGALNEQKNAEKAAQRARMRRGK